MRAPFLVALRITLRKRANQDLNGGFGQKKRETGGANAKSNPAPVGPHSNIKHASTCKRFDMWRCWEKHIQSSVQNVRQQPHETSEKGKDLPKTKDRVMPPAGRP